MTLSQEEFQQLLEFEKQTYEEISRISLSKLIFYKDLASQASPEQRKEILRLTAYKGKFSCCRCGSEIHDMRTKFGENFCLNCYFELSKGGITK